jgi:predicted enzyme related to lactoylglutathione lyase
MIFGLLTSFCFGVLFNALYAKQINEIFLKQPNDNLKPRKVAGVGGIFFKCKDPSKIKDWYKMHLGFDIDQYGTRFVWKESTDPPTEGSLQWSPFPEKDNYFDPSTKDFMINYRVYNLEELVKQLKREGVTIVDKIEAYDYGKFVHIMDIEGNKIELFEPNAEYGMPKEVENK